MFAFTSLRCVFRILLLVLLMAGVMAKPVLAFAGELHEAGHPELNGDHGHSDGLSTELEDPADTESSWHALLHLTHCGGQTPAMMPLMSHGPVSLAVAQPLPPVLAAFRPATQPVALRPPIRA